MSQKCHAFKEIFTTNLLPSLWSGSGIDGDGVARMNQVRNIEAPVIKPESQEEFRLERRCQPLADLIILTKARVNLLVVATTFAGFALHARSIDNPWLLVQTVSATGAVAGGAAIANQFAEWRFDQRMFRTRNRPIAAGRISRRIAILLSGMLVMGGCVWLWFGVNWLASLLAGISFFIYAFLYTPSKRLTPFCTLIGAVAGALPFLVGWVAVRPGFDVRAVIGFAVLFLWQVPHFLAIAWWRREEYRRAGFRVLPRDDHEGTQTAFWAGSITFLLLLVSIIPAFARSTAPWFASATSGAGLVFLAFYLRFAFRRTIESARTLFIVSIFYLPVLYVLLLFSQRS